MNLEQILKKIFGQDAAEQPPILGQPGPTIFPPMMIVVGNSDVAEMVKLIGSAMMPHYLRFRRAAADRWHPDWKDHPKHEMVQILDDCARFAATLN